MARAHYFDVALTHTGLPASIIPYAQITVYEAGTTNPIVATLYAGATGTTTKTNPFNADEHGNFEFYLAEPQDVKLVITGTGVGTITIDWVPVPVPVANQVTVDDDGLIEGAEPYYAKNFNIIRAELFIDVRDKGAVGDLEMRWDGNVSLANPDRITFTNAFLDSSYLGKTVTIANAIKTGVPDTGVVGNPLTATIVEIISATVLRHNGTATQNSYSPGSEEVRIGTQDHAAFKLARDEIANAGGGGTIYAPLKYLADQTNLSDSIGIHLKGAGVGTIYNTESNGVISYDGSLIAPIGSIQYHLIDFGRNRASSIRDISLCSQTSYLAKMTSTMKCALFIGRQTSGGNEPTDCLYENIQIRGNFTEAGIWLGGGVSVQTFKNVKVYQQFNGSLKNALAISGYNARNVLANPAHYASKVANALVSLGGFYFLEGCEFHEMAVAGGTPSAAVPIFIDCISSHVVFKGIASVSTNVICLISDGDVANPTRGLKFEHCELGNGSSVEPQNIILISSNSMIKGLEVVDNSFQNSAAVIGTSGAHTASGIDGLIFEGNRQDGTSTAALTFANASSSERLKNSRIDAMGKSVTINGITDAHTEIRNSSTTITGTKARVIGSGGIISPMVKTSINDENNNKIVGLSPVASANANVLIGNANSGTPAIAIEGSATNIDLSLAGKGTGALALQSNVVQANTNGYYRPGGVAPATPVANALYRNSFDKVVCSFTGLGVLDADSLNVSGITHTNNPGEWQVTFGIAFADTTYTVAVTIEDNIGSYGYVAPVANKSLGSVRVQCRRVDTNALHNPTKVHVRIAGRQ